MLSSFPQHGRRHASPFLTALHRGLAALCLLGLAPEVRSQWVGEPPYREVTPYRADLAGSTSWELSGRPGIRGAELNVPANTFLRSISIRMGDSPDPRGGFELHLFRIARHGSSGGMDHVVRLKGTANPATSGAHVYQVPAGVVLSGRYLLVAMVSEGGGTYRWMIEPGAKAVSDGSVFYGVFTVPQAPSNGGSTGTGGSSGGTLVLSGSGATLNVGGAVSQLATPLLTSINLVNRGTGALLPPGGTLILSNPQYSSGNLLNLGGSNTGGTNPGTQTTLGGSGSTINLQPPAAGTLTGNSLSLGSMSPLTSIQTPPSVSNPLLNPPSGLIGSSPGNVIITSGNTLTYSGGLIRPTETGPAPSSEEPAEEQTASAFLSASSEVAAAEETRLVLLPDLGETRRFAFTFQRGPADSLLQVQRPRPFSPVAVGTEGRTQRIRIGNVAETRIDGISIRTSGETKRHFRITATPRRSLDAGESTGFLLTAAPSRPGVRRGLIEVRSEAGREFLFVTVRGVRGVFSPRAGVGVP